jgi:ankyrin repeat protein
MDDGINQTAPTQAPAARPVGYSITHEQARRPTAGLASRLALARAPGNALRRLFPSLGRYLDLQLREAIESWATRSAKLWLLAGARPHAMSFPNMDVASRCARMGNAELLVWLCACGADPNARNSENWTPIHQASAKGHGPAIIALASSGADTAAKANNGWTPLILACRENRVEAIEVLCALGAPVDEPDERGEPPLLLCSRRGLEEAARMLLSHGARVDLTERRGFQAIHLAASQGYDGICLALIEAGADPEAAGPWSKTPAAISKAEGHASTLSLIERALLARLGATKLRTDTTSSGKARRL